MLYPDCQGPPLDLRVLNVVIYFVKVYKKGVKPMLLPYFLNLAKIANAFLVFIK